MNYLSPLEQVANIYESSVPISSVSVSPDQRYILIGGRDILKIVELTSTVSSSSSSSSVNSNNNEGNNTVYGYSLKDYKNLRMNRKKSSDLVTNDVRWHPLLDDHIATASTNGAILLWDLNRNKPIANIMNTVRHGRTVNRIVWNTVNESWLLSAGQDGVCHLWDTRCTGVQPSYPYYSNISNLHHDLHELNSSLTSTAGTTTANSVMTFSTGIDAVRDIQFDPFNPLIFSSAAEDGCIYTWDIRKSHSPLTRITAHVGLISTLAYHPTVPGIIATGGRDRLVKIWNIGNNCIHTNSNYYDQFITKWYNGLTNSMNSLNHNSSNDQQHLGTIQTMASVARLNWRLSSIHPWIPYGIEDNGNESVHLTLSDIHNNKKNTAVQYHLATCAALLDNICYVWDVRFPNIPVAMFHGHRDVVTGLLWTDTQNDNGTMTPNNNNSTRVNPVSTSSTLRPWLITSSKDGAVCVHNPKYAERPHMTLRTTTLAVGSRGIASTHHSIQRDAYWDNNHSILSSPIVNLPVSTGTGSSQRNFFVRDETSILPSMQHLLDPTVSLITKLATGYRTEGASIDTLCMQNAIVATEAEAVDLASMWKILHILYKPRPVIPLFRKQKLFEHTVNRRKLQFASKLRTIDTTTADTENQLNETPVIDDSSIIENGNDTTLSKTDTRNDTILLDFEEDTLDMYTNNPVPGYIIGLMESLAKVNPDASRFWLVPESLSFMDKFPRSQANDTASNGEINRNSEAAIDLFMKDNIKNQETNYSFASFFQSGGVDTSVLEEKDWDALRLRIVEDILRYYAEQGDVQTCVTISRIIGPPIEERIGKRLLQQWLVQYIDQLHQLELWSPASIVMARASDEGVRRLNQLSTSVISACGNCTQDAVQSSIPDVMPRNNDLSTTTGTNSKIFYADNEKYSLRLAHDPDPCTVHSHDASRTTYEPLTVANIGSLQPVAATQCRSCANDISTCSICQETVKGLYTWCQGCGHGGHVHHLTEWFKTSTLCPAGCMHVCLLT